jgi:cbb3-type cytochrome oxidase cytochrome c subunit
MKGLAPLFLGIFGTFAFSWVGLTVIPNWQIGHLDPQMEEDGTDVYPQPQSGMVERGARVYAANGCIYCHSQQVRADYSADDIERKWGDRRSAPRDYIFERPIFLGKMRMGQDLSNIGARAPAEQENAPPAGAATPATSPAPQGGAAPPPAPSAAPSGANPSPPTKAGSPPPGPPPSKAATSPPPAGSPAASPSPSPASLASSAAAALSPNAPPISPSPSARANASPAASPSPRAGSPATSPAASPSPKAPAGPAPKAPLASPSPSAVANASPAASASPAAGAPWPVQTSGQPPMYSAAWHHVHLYSPRSINVDSNMPSYRFLYQTRRITDMASADALGLTGSEAPTEGWEIVPTYDAKCLVAYLMSLNQSHPLKGIRSAATASSSPSPAASPAK